MKFSDAMKAMEAGEVVRIKGSVSYFVKPAVSPSVGALYSKTERQASVPGSFIRTRWSQTIGR